MSCNVGENIAKYRKINGISQKNLAMKIPITPQGLLKIEKGQVSPRAVTLERIIRVIGITPNQLFGIEEITEENGNLIEMFKRYRAME